MNEIEVCISGNVGTEPTRVVVNSGSSYARFRLATSPRFRGADGEFRDGETQWFTVKAWGDLGENVIASLHKGAPVLLRGKLQTETWGENNEHSATVVMANAIGHNLRNGTTAFTRTVRESAAGDVPGADGERGDALVGPDGTRYDAAELESAELERAALDSAAAEPETSAV
ncbi:single-stranded DNA-binding protein [Georgenia deserti]|uniref:Single-stranded DNA-binding protein n=1 Tax=Georgenia deserti TaxID=2093781 RepID=A0ABW4LC17_9MICO